MFGRSLTIPINRLYFPFRAVLCRILWSNSVSISHRSLKSSSLGEFRFLARRFIDVYINHHPKQFFLFSFLFWIWFYFICTDYACLSASSLFACYLNRSDSVDGFLFSLEFLVSSAVFVYRPRSIMLNNFVKEKTEQKDTNNKNKTEQIKLVPNAKKGGFAPFIFQIHRFGCHVFVFFTF